MSGIRGNGDRKLIAQLKSEGATVDEAKAMATLADSIQHLKPRGLAPGVKQAILEDIHIKPHKSHPMAWGMVGSFAMLLIIIVGVSQSSLPGSWLYNVKRGGEVARQTVQPSYVDKVVETRSAEVQELKAEKASPIVIQKAENNYQKAVEKAKSRQAKNQKTKTTPKTPTKSTNTKKSTTPATPTTDKSTTDISESGSPTPTSADAKTEDSSSSSSGSGSTTNR